MPPVSRCKSIYERYEISTIGSFDGCETGSDKRMLILAGHPCAHAPPASPGLIQCTDARPLSRYIGIQKRFTL